MQDVPHDRDYSFLSNAGGKAIAEDKEMAGVDA